MPEAIHRETQIKAWKRYWKIELIEGFNGDWLDLHDVIEYRPYTWENRGSKSPSKIPVIPNTSEAKRNA